jgi:hypothetical protein
MMLYYYGRCGVLFGCWFNGIATIAICDETAEEKREILSEAASGHGV